MKTWKKIKTGEESESDIGFPYILKNLSDEDREKLKALAEKMNVDIDDEKKQVIRKSKKKNMEEYK